MKYLITLLILFYNLVPAQVSDSGSVSTTVIPDSSKLIVKSLSLSDSTKQKILPDTLHPVYVSPFSSNSSFISYQKILRSDYRYAGDILNNFSFNFTRDFGFTGQPNETVIYGAGFNGISYFEDGILYNNRFTNSLDLNLVQTESIDSIEIISLPRGFLYGPYNNPVSVNFITKDFLSRPPYTRIKYYQGPFGEAMIDGFFNAWLYKKLNVSFDITNRKADDRYTNSSFSLWQSRLKLKYLLSDKINVISSLYYVTSKTGLNGGVDVSQITGTQSEITSTLYDELLAPVFYTDRAEQTKQMNYSIKLLGKFTDNSKTDLSFYYRSTFDAISGERDTAYFANTDRNYILGVNLKHNMTLNILDFTVLANYEKFEINYDEVFGNSHPVYNYNSSIYSAAAIVSFIGENKSIIPSVFYKISHNSLYTNPENKTGMGLDLRINLTENFSVYIGYSFYNNIGNRDIKNFEASSNYKNDKLYVGFKYFLRQNYSHALTYFNGPIPLTSNINGSEADMSGLGGQINYEFGKFIIENSGAYYGSSYSHIQYFSSVPEYTYRGGFYYKDLLFKDNLDLKAGFVFYYNGKRTSKENTALTPIVEANSRLDLTFTGVIQKVATIYFTWQNLLNQKYFIIPYYPMPKQSIRFGIAWELFN